MNVEESKTTRFLHDETEVTAISAQTSQPSPLLAGDDVETVSRDTTAGGTMYPLPVENAGIGCGTITSHHQGSPRHTPASTASVGSNDEEYSVPGMESCHPPICESHKCKKTVSMDNAPEKESFVTRRESAAFENTYALHETDEISFKAVNAAKSLESTFEVNPSTASVKKSASVSQAWPDASSSEGSRSVRIPCKPYGLSNRDSLSSTLVLKSSKSIFTQYSTCPTEGKPKACEEAGIQCIQECEKRSEATNGAVVLSSPSSDQKKRRAAAEASKESKTTSDVSVPKNLRLMYEKPEGGTSTELTSKASKKKHKKQNERYVQKLFPTVSAPAGILREGQRRPTDQNALGDKRTCTRNVTSGGAQERAEKKAEICNNPVLVIGDRVQEHAQRLGAVANSSQLITAVGLDSRLPEQLQGVILIKRELCLYPISMILFLGVIAIILVSFPTAPATGRRFLELILNETSVGHGATGQPRQSLLCSSSGCPVDAAYLQSLLSWDVDPCANFYQFVCGRWASQYLAEGEQITRRKTTFDDEYVTRLESRMHTVLKGTAKSNFLRPLQDVFKECTSVQDLEKSGWDPLLELLAMSSLEGFPFTPPVRSSVSVWEIAAKVLKLTGAAVLLNVNIAAHPNVKHRDIVALDVPDTFVDSTGSDINEAIRYYHDIVYTSVKVLRKEFIPAVHTMQVVNFAYELESLLLEKPVTSKARVEELSAYPEFIAFLSEAFDDITSPAYQNGSHVLFRYPDFTTNLLYLVRNAEVHTAMNFLGVRLMVHASAFTPQTDLLEAYGTLLYRKLVTNIPRWKLCVRVTEHAMPPLFLLAFLLEIRTKSVTTDLFKLVRAVADEVASGLDYSSFLDDADKKAARNIVATTQYKVLGPTWLGDKNLVEDYLSRIPKAAQGEGLMSYVALRQYVFSNALARDSSVRWTGSVFRTDCWVEGYPRTIHVPVLIFNVSSLAYEPKAFQLPRAGVRIARCILRMLLETVHSGAWMSKASRQKTDEKLRCLRGRYGPRLETSMRQLEDNVAVHLTFKHFVKVVRDFGNWTQVHRRPDNDLLAEQLFFVYLMLQSCETLNETNRRSGQVPANVPLQNERGFSEAFGCGQSTTMNPPQKCLWENP